MEVHNINHLKRTIAFLSPLLLVFFISCAQDKTPNQKETKKEEQVNEPNPFPVSKTGDHSIRTAKKDFPYTLIEYQGKVRINPLPREETSTDTPEDTLVSFISAMSAGDYEWWYSLWDSSSQKFMSETDQKWKRSPEETKKVLTGIWEEFYDSGVTYALARVDYPPYAAIYCLSSPREQNRGSGIMCKMRKENGRWYVNQKQFEDPIFINTFLGLQKEGGYILKKIPVQRRLRKAN